MEVKVEIHVPITFFRNDKLVRELDCTFPCTMELAERPRIGENWSISDGETEYITDLPKVTDVFVFFNRNTRETTVGANLDVVRYALRDPSDAFINETITKLEKGGWTVDQ